MSEQRTPGHKRDEVDVVAVPERPGTATTWTLFLAGPTIWFLHFLAVYLVTEAVCTLGEDAGGRWLGLPTVSGYTLAATAVAVVTMAGSTTASYRRWRAEERARRSADGDGSDAAAGRGKDRALAFAGFLLGVLFVVAVLMVGLPAIWLSPC
jgi:hypothetical protein